MLDGPMRPQPRDDEDRSALASRKAGRRFGSSDAFPFCVSRRLLR